MAVETDKPAEQAQQARQQSLEVKLVSGETIRARVGSEGTARTELEQLHSRLRSELYILLGEDTVVRSEEIRWIQLRDEGSDSGVIDSLMSRIRGGDDMSTQTYDREQMQHRQAAPFGTPWVGYGRRPFAETKPFFLTSEFLTLLGSITAVAIALGVSDALNGFKGWLLLTILPAAYMLSRGIAKAGARDPRPDIRDGQGGQQQFRGSGTAYQAGADQPLGRQRDWAEQGGR
jgi:hypothetical protein